MRPSPARWPGPIVYPWPQRPAGLVEEAFAELARRWRPILDVFDEDGVDVCYEIHPGEDLHDGVDLRDVPRSASATTRAPTSSTIRSHFVLQQLDYLAFIDIYHERIKVFHVKDAEFNPTGAPGVYGGYQPWVERAGRFRSLGDGQVDFGGDLLQADPVRLRRLGGARMGMRLKHPEQGAREGAPFIAATSSEGRQGLRRFRRRRHGRGRQPARCWGSADVVRENRPTRPRAGRALGMRKRQAVSTTTSSCRAKKLSGWQRRRLASRSSSSGSGRSGE